MTRRGEATYTEHVRIVAVGFLTGRQRRPLDSPIRYRVAGREGASFSLTTLHFRFGVIRPKNARNSLFDKWIQNLVAPFAMRKKVQGCARFEETGIESSDRNPDRSLHCSPRPPSLFHTALMTTRVISSVCGAPVRKVRTDSTMAAWMAAAG